MGRATSNVDRYWEHYQFFFENEPWRRPTVDETILKYGNLVTVPGERFRYSNLGYGVLSYVISRVSGQPFADYLRRSARSTFIAGPVKFGRTQILCCA